MLQKTWAGGGICLGVSQNGFRHSIQLSGAGWSKLSFKTLTHWCPPFSFTPTAKLVLGKMLSHEILRQRIKSDIWRPDWRAKGKCFTFVTSQVLSEISWVWRYLLMKISSRGWKTIPHILVSVLIHAKVSSSSVQTGYGILSMSVPLL